MRKEALLAFQIQAAIESFFGFQQIQDKMPSNIDVFSSILNTHSAHIFAEIHIQNPVQTVLDRPMAALGSKYLRGGHILFAVQNIVDRRFLRFLSDRLHVADDHTDAA